jgi:hypothetical protein
MQDPSTSLTDAQANALCALESDFRGERLHAIQRSGERFLLEVRGLASMHGAWDSQNKYARVNIMALGKIFCALAREMQPEAVAWFTIDILLPRLQKYSTSQSKPISFEFTYEERIELSVFSNWMAFVLRFISGHGNKTLVMAVVCDLSNAQRYKGGGGATLHSRRLEAIFHVLCDIPKHTRIRPPRPRPTVLSRPSHEVAQDIEAYENSFDDELCSSLMDFLNE